VPQELDRALVAVLGQHAGAAEFDELQIAVPFDQPANVEFAGGVEAAIVLGERLTQQTIGADHGRPALRAAVAALMIDDEKVIANGVVSIDVAAGDEARRVRHRRALLEEHAVAQLLRLTHFRRGLRQPHLERADAAEALRRPMRAGGESLHPAIGL